MACGSPPPYYWNVPQDFVIPSVYFPVPEITTYGDTFTSYRFEYMWYIKCFAKTANDAHAMGLAVVSAIKEHRNIVPLIDEDGALTGKGFRLLDPSARAIEDGVCQITIRWNSPRPYYDVLHPSAELMQKYTIKDFYRPDIYLAEKMRIQFIEAMERYRITYPVAEAGQTINI
ncbi:MAG: hypothetical protein PHS57_05755 [Alphaproteobacteria bacterium]|nr:hypothetical protein [Alphaproteobacteria bacterium]